MTMNSNPKLDAFVCSSGTHFLRYPLRLECGHLLCSYCFVKDASKITIKCMKCNKICRKNAYNEVEYGVANKMIKTYLSDLFVEIEKQTLDKLNEFKCLLESSDGTVDVHFTFVEEEIEIRVECIKIKLEEHLEMFKNDLKEMKDKFKTSRQWLANDEMRSLKSFEDRYLDLQSYCSGKEKQNEEKFYEFQENLKKLNEKMKKFQENLNDFQLIFEPSTDKIISENLIGKVELLRGVARRNIIYLLKKRRFETIEVFKGIREICRLPNNQLLCATSDSLRIYDGNFKIVDEILEVNRVKLRPMGITVSHQNERIYVANGCNKLLMMDFDFKMLKQRAISRAAHFHGMCCKNDFLYVCDNVRGVIRILDDKLTDLDTFIKVDYEPYYVTASDHVTAVSGSDGLYFYDLSSRSYNRKYTDVYGRVCENNSKFCVLENRTMISHLYDSFGIPIEKIDNSLLSIKLEHVYDGQVLIIDENLYMNCYTDRKILKF